MRSISRPELSGDGERKKVHIYLAWSEELPRVFERVSGDWRRGNEKKLHMDGFSIKVYSLVSAPDAEKGMLGRGN